MSLNLNSKQLRFHGAHPNVHSTQIEDHFRAKATKLLIRILGVELMQFYDHV